MWRLNWLILSDFSKHGCLVATFPSMCLTLIFQHILIIATYASFLAMETTFWHKGLEDITLREDSSSKGHRLVTQKATPPRVARRLQTLLLVKVLINRHTL